MELRRSARSSTDLAEREPVAGLVPLGLLTAAEELDSGGAPHPHRAVLDDEPAPLFEPHHGIGVHRVVLADPVVARLAVGRHGGAALLVVRVDVEGHQAERVEAVESDHVPVIGVRMVGPATLAAALAPMYGMPPRARSRMASSSFDSLSRFRSAYVLPPPMNSASTPASVSSGRWSQRRWTSPSPAPSGGGGTRVARTRSK